MAIDVSYDAGILHRQRRGGVSRYFAKLIREFREEPDLGVSPRMLGKWSSSGHLVDERVASRLRPGMLDRPRIVRALNAVHGPRRPGDLNHLTWYNSRNITPSAPSVITIHDMIPERCPELFPSGTPHGGKQECYERADLVICVSQATLDEVVTIYGPSATAILRAIPLGVDQEFSGRLRPCQLPAEFIIYVGDRKVYKDFGTAVRALALLSKRFPSLQLVVVGGGPATVAERELVAQLGLAHDVHFMSLADDQLAYAYTRATCFVFPSHHEGFGLPTLEALSCGTPTVVADTAVSREVGAEAVRRFQPGDPESLADAVGRTVVDSIMTQQLRALGLKRVRHYTWKRTAAATASAYQEALSQ